MSLDYRNTTKVEYVAPYSKLKDLPKHGVKSKFSCNRPWYLNGPNQNIVKTKIWVSTTTCTMFWYMHIEHLKACIKRIVSLETMPSHLESLYCTYKRTYTR